MRVAILLILSLSLSTAFGQMQVRNIDELRKILFTVRKKNDKTTGIAFVAGANNTHVFLLTAKHVIAGGTGITITSLAGASYNAEVVEQHPVHDLALLSISAKNITATSIPIITNVAMNDEVGFISVNKSGVVLPTAGGGLVRDVTGESLTLLMREVEAGDSGSPLLCRDGIVGIILKNGRFIDCMNIKMAQEILENWADGQFKVLLRPGLYDRPVKNDVKTFKQEEDIVLPILSYACEGRCASQAGNLVDSDLDTEFKCSGGENDIAMIFFNLPGSYSMIKFKIYYPEDSPYDLPRGGVTMYYGNTKNELDFDTSLLYKERAGEGHWYVYGMKRYVRTNQVAIVIRFPSTEPTVAFNEIQIIGMDQ